MSHRVIEPAGLEGGPSTDPYSEQHTHALVRALETAATVRRRYQFFIWSQSYLQPLVPHQLAVCGAYQRTRKEVAFEAFNSVPVSVPALAIVTDGGSALMQQLIGLWIDRRGSALSLNLGALAGVCAGEERDALVAAGFEDLLVHGVSRPQRPAELESLFIFGTPQRRSTPQEAVYLELLVPHLHSLWLRVLATERELNGVATGRVPQRADSAPRTLITDRENQILFWVREGKSNQEIGDQLGISVLTVKNHVQKILRKLGAANRAQAVAKAMSLNLLEHSGGRVPGYAE